VTAERDALILVTALRRGMLTALAEELVILPRGRRAIADGVEDLAKSVPAECLEEQELLLGIVRFLRQ
jgi:hypothetical protein